MIRKLPFTKMEGIGNDYVYINGFVEQIQDPHDLAKKISDRHFGVGSDGLVLVLPSAFRICVCGCSMRMAQKLKCAAMRQDAWASLLLITV